MKASQVKKNQISLAWICGCIAAYGMFLRIIKRAQVSFAGDELLQYEALKQATFTFWRRVAFYGDHTSFPGELIVNFPFVKIWDMNKWIVSIPHLTLNIIGFFFFYKICKRFLQTRLAVIIAFMIYSLNFNLVYHSIEFRPYAILHVLAIISLYLADILVNRYDCLSNKDKTWIALLLIFIINYHGFGIAIAVLPLMYMFYLLILSSPQKKSYHGLPYLSLVLIIATAIWCWYASYNLFRIGLPPVHAGQNYVPVFEFIPDPTRDLIGFAKGVIGNLFGGRIFYPLLIIVAAAFLIPSNARQYLSFMGLFIFLVVGPVSAILLIDLKTQYWFLQRQFIWAVPFWALFIGQCWDRVVLRASYKIL